MWSLVTVSLFFLTKIVIVVTTQNVNIDVYSHTRDDTILETIRLVADAITVDNRYFEATVNEKDCNSAEAKECSGHQREGLFVVISSSECSNVQVSGFLEKNSQIYDEVLKLLFHFLSQYYPSRAQETDNFDWWSHQLTAPSVKHLEQLDRLIDKNNKGIVFVLYYEPDGFKNFAAFYAARNLFSSDLVRGLVVDCSRESAICERESVYTLPTLIAYDKGKKYKAYPHDMDVILIHDWIKTLQQPVITKLTEGAVPYYREGAIPGFDDPRPSVIMFFSSTRKSEIYKNYKRFARQHHGDYHLTELIDQGIEKWAHQPAFVAMKPLETISKANTLYDNITYENMAEFIEENRHPSVHHLNDLLSLFTVFSLNRPVLIFYDVTKTMNTTIFATAAANYSLRSAVAFALSRGLSMPGLFLANHLGIDVLKPGYVLVDATRKCAYMKRIEEENEMEIENWLKTAANGACKEVTLDMGMLTALRDWERRDDLRRDVEEYLSQRHDEL